MRVSVAFIAVVAPTQGTVEEPNATAASNGVFFGALPGTPRPFREQGIDSYDVLPLVPRPLSPDGTITLSFFA